VAKALAAGRPQLVVPFSFDQLDNALRVKRLGAGDWLERNNRSAPAMAAKLESILDRQVASQAQRCASRLRERSGLERAADLIDEFRATSSKAPVLAGEIPPENGCRMPGSGHNDSLQRPLT
jgi:UDP:flavonoid glycosyltransferase YjiC (YdhE family)